MTPTVSAISKFRDDLRAGEILLGPSVYFSDPRVTDALADSCDFVWFDTEHALVGAEALIGHLLAARAHNLPFLLRVPVGVTSVIKPALDAGVPGLIVPQVRSVAEVRAVVDDCRYAPRGRRGFGPVFASSYGRLPLSEVADRNADDLFIAIQIENTQALAVVEEIASIEGIDALVVGPTDLSDSLGLRGKFEHPTVTAAIDRIVAAARSNSLSVGAGVGDAAHAVAMIRRGAQWIQLSGADALMWRHFEQLTGDVRLELASSGQA
jgi:2-keto-3-deoxy-L-rhamnonate aldolase RhmA